MSCLQLHFMIYKISDKHTQLRNEFHGSHVQMSWHTFYHAAFSVLPDVQNTTQILYNKDCNLHELYYILCDWRYAWDDRLHGEHLIVNGFDICWPVTQKTRSSHPSFTKLHQLASRLSNNVNALVKIIKWSCKRKYFHDVEQMTADSNRSKY